MNAAIVAIGSELLGPYRLDTNSLYLTDQLNRLGISVTLKTVVGDKERDISDAILNALKVAEVVITTGGLGPTADDLTRESVARLLGRRVLRDDHLAELIERRFRARGI